MLGFVATIHVIISLILVLLVLIQDSKGGAMGMLGGGGGGNTVFGSTGAANFLVRATRWIAISFAATSIALAYMTSRQDDSVLNTLVPPIESATTNKIIAPDKKADAQQDSTDKKAADEPKKEDKK